MTPTKLLKHPTQVLHGLPVYLPHDNEDVATDASVVHFLTLLNNLVPGGVSEVVNPIEPTPNGLVKLAALFIWSGTAEHGAAGQTMCAGLPRGHLECIRSDKIQDAMLALISLMVCVRGWQYPRRGVDCFR